MVYVSHIEDDNALILDGPEIHDLDQRLLTSYSVEDIAGSWELPFIEEKVEEWRATRFGATVALDLIEQLRQPPGRLLDFGCGSGFFLGEAKERGWEPFGLEPLPGHATHARARFGASVVTDTLHEDTFPPHFFDVVTSFQVFEHLPDPVGNLSLLHRNLKPGGVILIEVPNIDTWSIRLFGKRHRHFAQDHLNFFSARSIALFLEERGFLVKNTYSPARQMTVRHLITFWGRRYLPEVVTDLMEWFIKHLGLWERIVKVNLGDILTVIASKDQFIVR
jgi:SAM-dependent methyltransferase